MKTAHDRRGFWTQRGVIPRWQLVLVYLLIVAAGAAGFSKTSAQQDDIQDLSQRTNAALCALRGDLQDRVYSGEQFLATHPHGIPGVPVATLRQSIDGQRRTVTALSSLRC